MEEEIARLQAAARVIAARLVPGAAVDLLRLLDRDGRVLFAVAVPPAACEPPAGRREDDPPPPAGWDVTDRRALYDGVPVKVAPSRLKLLRVLAAAEAPLCARDLLGPAFDRHTSETNARFHVAELRKELAAAFPEFDGELIEATGAGYSLAIR